MMTDLRFAFRQLIKSPGFTLLAALTLALGIGANTAIFSLINSFLLKPLPYPDSDRVTVVAMDTGGNGNAPTSGGIFLDFEESATQFEAIAAFHTASYNLTGIEDPVRLNGQEVTSGYLKVLGVTVALGRDFVADDELPGGDARLVLLSDPVWRSQFGADPSIVNKTITLDYQPYTVIGVLRPSTFIVQGIDFLSPAAIRVAEHKQRRNFTYVCTIIGRLATGATLASAESELESIKAGLNEQYPEMMKAWGFTVRTLQDAFFSNSRPYLLTLLVAVGMVLLVACANVANLLLARAAARQGEIAVRAALGASGWKIVRQLLCESVMLASLGGLMGLVLGISLLKPLALAIGLDQFPNIELEIDPAVLAFTISISVATGLLFGTLPAVKAARQGAASGMKETTRSATSAKGNSLQSALIVGEIALTVVLLVCIGLLVKSFANAFATDPGFDRENVLTFEIARSATKATTHEDYVRFTDQALERIKRVPGVENAAMISTTPMNSATYYGAPFWRDDQPDAANSYFTGFDSVNGDIFATLGIPLLRGRSIEPFDQTPDAPKVVVISQRVVDDVFKDEDPIGHIVHHDNEVWQVVGVVGNISRFSLDSGPQAIVYKPQMKWPWATSYVVRTRLPPLQLAKQIEAAVQEIDPEQPLDRVRTLEEAVANSLSARVVMVSLIGIFGAMAALLAAMGVYGLTAYMVEQRHREFGIRLAIGALPGQIVSMVMKRGLVLALIGVAVGAAAALGLGRLLAFVLYQVDPYDPLVLSSVALLTLLIAAMACWRPASAASHVNPSDALRAE